jgi:hypothetical protein
MNILDIVCEIADLWLSWRFYLCVATSVGLAIFLHTTFEDHTWVWFISIPLVLFGFVLGFCWQAQADRK